MISIFQNKIKDGQSVSIFGDGEQYRDFIYVKDVVKANIAAMTTDTGVFDVFCVGTKRKTSINGLIEILQKRYQSDVEISYQTSRAGDIKESICDNSKLLSILNIRMDSSLEDNVKLL